MFGAVGAFSGLVDLWDRYPVGAGILLAPMLLDGPESDALQRWGNPVTDAANWHAQNPTDLAARLHGTRVVYIAGGNGVPSDAQEAQDDAGPGLGPQALVEQEVGAMTANYDKALTAAGVVHVYRPHAGLHDPRHWRDDLAAFWSRVRAAWRR